MLWKVGIGNETRKKRSSQNKVEKLIQANDAQGLVKAFHNAVDNYLTFCNEKAIKPEQPFKGSLNVRIGPKRHLKTWKAAQALDKSLNDYICQALDESFEKKSLVSRKIKSNKKTFLAEKRKSN